MERGIRRCANSRRRHAGLRPLNPGRPLARAARFHAQSMSKGGFFSHVDPHGRGPGNRVAMFGGHYRAVGENIAAGQRGPRALCRAWMHSPGHRENILRPGFNQLGGGFASGGPYRRYYVLTLGRG